MSKDGKQYRLALPLEIIRMMTESLAEEYSLASPDEQNHILSIMQTCRDIYSWMAPILYRSVSLQGPRAVHLFRLQSLRPALRYTRSMRIVHFVDPEKAEKTSLYQLISSLQKHLQRLTLPSSASFLANEGPAISIPELTLSSDRSIEYSRVDWICPTRLRITPSAGCLARPQGAAHFPQLRPVPIVETLLQVTEIALECLGWCETCLIDRLQEFVTAFPSLRRCILVVYSYDTPRMENQKEMLLSRLSQFESSKEVEVEVKVAFLLAEDHSSLSFRRLEGHGENYWTRIEDLFEVGKALRVYGEGFRWPLKPSRQVNPSPTLITMKLQWPRLTILGRSIALIGSLILLNIGCWIAAAIVFKPHSSGDASGLLGLAMLSWTIGLRHALDADHISAIDNATRGLINLGQLPVTCGLFFSLGHSTIVVAFIIAIAISTDVFDRAGGFGDVGGIIGASISGSFLFIIGTVNSVILYRIIQDRRRAAQFKKKGLPVPESRHTHATFLIRVLSPVTRIVDRPWKMYPVGVLFGLGTVSFRNGFDTASSIALLAVSALAKRDAQGKGIPASSIIILPFLFTSGMTLVDSLDSVLMLYSYSGFPEKGWALFRGYRRNEGTKQRVKRTSSLAQLGRDVSDMEAQPTERIDSPTSPKQSKRMSQDDEEARRSPAHVADRNDDGDAEREEEEEEENEEKIRKEQAVVLKNNSMSTLSILLTLISILLAYAIRVLTYLTSITTIPSAILPTSAFDRISLITIMSLIGEQCGKCRAAAEADEGKGGGLAGSWWRAWAKAADASGYIGAGLVGAFALLVGVWYLIQYMLERKKKEKNRGEENKGPSSGNA